MQENHNRTVLPFGYTDDALHPIRNLPRSLCQRSFAQIITIYVVTGCFGCDDRGIGSTVPSRFDALYIVKQICRHIGRPFRNRDLGICP